MFVQIIGGVRESGEDEHLAIAGIDWSFDLGHDVLFQVLQLGVVGWGDLFHLAEERLDQTEIGLQVVLPRGEVHVSELDVDLATGVKCYFGKILVNGEIKTDYSPIRHDRVENVGE